MNAEEKQHQVEIGALLRHRRKSQGRSVQSVVDHCKRLGWSDITPEKLNRWETGVSGHGIMGLKTLAALYGISNKELADPPVLVRISAGITMGDGTAVPEGKDFRIEIPRDVFDEVRRVHDSTGRFNGDYLILVAHPQK
jgi:hypothetical protein